MTISLELVCWQFKKCLRGNTIRFTPGFGQNILLWVQKIFKLNTTISSSPIAARALQTFFIERIWCKEKAAALKVI